MSWFLKPYRIALLGSAITIIALAATAYYTLRPQILTVGFEQGDQIARKVLGFVASRLENDRSLRLVVREFTDTEPLTKEFVEKRIALAVLPGDAAFSGDARAIAILRRSAIILLTPTTSKRSGAVDPTSLRIVVEDARTREIVLRIDDTSKPWTGSVLIDADPVAALERRQGDAIAVLTVAGGLPTGLREALERSKRGWTMLEINQGEALRAVTRWLEAREIPPRALSTKLDLPDDEASTIGINSFLLGVSTLPDQATARLTRLVVEAKGALARQPLIAAELSPPDIEVTAYPRAHPGSTAFVDRSEPSFFELYGDMIYIGMALSGLFGSLTAASWARFRSVIHDGGLRHLARMHILLREAGDATDQQRLNRVTDALEKAVITFSSEILDGRVERDTIRAFNLVHDAVRHAIVDRRKQLDLKPVVIQPATSEAAPAMSTDRGP